MRKIYLYLFIFSFLFSFKASAQDGDQILDGIGETGLVARYILNGDVKDWSRNNLNGVIRGENITFINDRRFGNVLSLPGKGGSYLTLPPDVLDIPESASLSFWVFLRSDRKGQVLADFGSNAGSHIYIAPRGTQNKDGFQVVIAEQGQQEKSIAVQSVPLNRWVYITVVLDVSTQSVRVFADGKPAGEIKGVATALSRILDREHTGKCFFYLGKSANLKESGAEALIHDFRIYRIPLSTGQIAGIYGKVRRGINDGAVNVRKQEADLPKFSEAASRLYNAYLNNVAGVTVETELGVLPRLPTYLSGSYNKGVDGPMVRVLWPADIDNTAVRKPGRYTITGSVPGTAIHPQAVIEVKDGVSFSTPRQNLQPFLLSQVTLQSDMNGNKTKFIENRDKFINTLAQTDPNSFLYMFRHAYGQNQPDGAKPLGVWDSKETKLRGHATGHYMSALAQAYASTGYDKTLQKKFADKIDYLVNTLYGLSELSGHAKDGVGAFNADPAGVPVAANKADYDSDLSDEGIRNDYWNWGKGFISAYPPDQFIMLEKGAKYGSQNNMIWAPYYTLHKILAGLMDIHEVTGNKKALDIVIGMSDWVYERLRRLPTETLISMWNTYIAGEFGGMNDAMARLYLITGEQKYMETARLLDNIRLFYGDEAHSGGLAKNVDLFRGLHANQHIPQIVGAVEEYKASGNAEYYRIADNFWYRAVNDYSYSIGGVAGARNPANAECFTAQPATLYENGFSEGGQNETCATYNMLKLTGNLFMYDQRGELMDYYERALYNHILASVAENTAANTYHVPLRPGSVKQFSNPNMTGFTCCNGTALESSTKLQNTIYYRSTDNNALYVNLYIPSTLQWTERDITIEQQTNFPNDDITRLLVKGKGKFDLKVRVPGWATKGFFVKINGKVQKVNAQPGTYLSINRKWENGDVVELRMPFGFHLLSVMDQPNIASLFYGPVLLAAQEPEPRKDWREVVLDPLNLSKTINGNPKKLEFIIEGIHYKPFYNTYGRHSVYLDVRF